MSSRFDAAAEDLRRLNLEANATDSERARLIAEADPSVILILLVYGDDMVVRTGTR